MKKQYLEISRETRVVRCPEYRQQFTKDPTKGGVPVGEMELVRYVDIPITFVREIPKGA